VTSPISIRGTVVGLGAAAMVAAGTVGANVTGALGDTTPSDGQVAKQRGTRVAASSGEASVDQGASAQARRQAVAATMAAQRAKAVKAVAAARLTKQRAGRSAARTYSGDPRAIARRTSSARYGWGSGQFGCLNSLWQRESGWNHRASNPSGAYGIPQALPGSKMSSKGSDWRTNPATQIAWGLSYIDKSYGSPCAAWSKARAQGWY
jgi:hypothetical protein